MTMNRSQPGVNLPVGKLCCGNGNVLTTQPWRRGLCNVVLLKAEASSRCGFYKNADHGINRAVFSYGLRHLPSMDHPKAGTRLCQRSPLA